MPLETENFSFTSLAGVAVSELPLQVSRCLQPAFCFSSSCSFKVQVKDLVFLQSSITGRQFNKLEFRPTPHLIEEVVQLHIYNHPDIISCEAEMRVQQAA